MIKTLHEQGQSFGEIATFLGMERTVVYRILIEVLQVNQQKIHRNVLDRQAKQRLLRTDNGDERCGK